MTFADSLGGSKVTLARAGSEPKEGVSCSTALFENRGPALFASLFMIEGAVSGVGIAYPAVEEGGEEVLIKLGRASEEKMQQIVFNDQTLIRGLYGAYTEN